MNYDYWLCFFQTIYALFRICPQYLMENCRKTKMRRVWHAHNKVSCNCVLELKRQFFHQQSFAQFDAQILTVCSNSPSGCARMMLWELTVFRLLQTHLMKTTWRICRDPKSMPLLQVQERAAIPYQRKRQKWKQQKRHQSSVDHSLHRNQSWRECVSCEREKSHSMSNDMCR